MAKVNFYLKEPSLKNETLIYLFFHYKGSRLKYSTGETILPKFWNEEEQRVKKSLTGHSEINGLLDRIEECIKKIYREGITFGNRVTNEYLKEKLNKELDLSAKGSVTIFDYFNEFMEVKKSFMAYATIQKYKTLKNHLLQFQSKKGVIISFEKIDLRFIELFTAYCINDLKLVNNSIAKYIKTLKTFLRWATDRGYNTNLSFNK